MTSDRNRTGGTPRGQGARLRSAWLLIACAGIALLGAWLVVRSTEGGWRFGAAEKEVAAGLVVAVPSGATKEIGAPMPTVLGRPEGCLVCHGNVTGFDGSHRPERIGCASCHAGDTDAIDKGRAHVGMILVPGNIADASRTCGQVGCHAAIVPRVERSIMATMAGVIAVDRRVVGEAVDPNAPPPHARELGHSAADSHLRELCVMCHLGHAKTEWGPIGQESQGGGCNACHLVYAPAAATELARYKATAPGARTAIPNVHPTLTLNPTNEHCFGCHSRSGRIATNFEGWHELSTPPSPETLKSVASVPPRYRRLDDGRVFERVVPDIHHERGLDCIDCHTANELMGSGAIVARKSEQLRVGCEDCHARELASMPAESLGFEPSMLIALRQWTLTPGQRIGATRTGEPLVNVVVDANGGGRLLRKRTGQSLPLRPPLPVCTEGKGHARLACTSCHSAWAPRCPTCHTSFDPTEEGFDQLAQTWVKGTWNETAGPFEAAPPTLGVRSYRGVDGRARSSVETFVPGMVLTFDRNRESGKRPDIVFRRLYGHIFAHTIRREVRSCASCHSDPVALGYGRGTLDYRISGTTGRWRFKPQFALSPFDGLPADAWIGFLQSRSGMVSSRDDVRPFTIDEQRRILRVGACLNCHAGDSDVMKRAVADFDAVLAQRSARCALPAWK
jgi:hypothetical protein